MFFLFFVVGGNVIYVCVFVRMSKQTIHTAAVNNHLLYTLSLEGDEEGKEREAYNRLVC